MDREVRFTILLEDPKFKLIMKKSLTVDAQFVFMLTHGKNKFVLP